MSFLDLVRFFTLKRLSSPRGWGSDGAMFRIKGTGAATGFGARTGAGVENLGASGCLLFPSDLSSLHRHIYKIEWASNE